MFSDFQNIRIAYNPKMKVLEIHLNLLIKGKQYFIVIYLKVIIKFVLPRSFGTHQKNLIKMNKENKQIKLNINWESKIVNKTAVTSFTDGETISLTWFWCIHGEMLYFRQNCLIEIVESPLSFGYISWRIVQTSSYIFCSKKKSCNKFWLNFTDHVCSVIDIQHLK